MATMVVSAYTSLNQDSPGSSPGTPSDDGVPRFTLWQRIVNCCYQPKINFDNPQVKQSLLPQFEIEDTREPRSNCNSFYSNITKGFNNFANAIAHPISASLLGTAGLVSSVYFGYVKKNFWAAIAGAFVFGHSGQSFADLAQRNNKYPNITKIVSLVKRHISMEVFLFIGAFRQYMISLLVNSAWAGMAIRDIIRQTQKKSSQVLEPKKSLQKRTYIPIIARIATFAIGAITAGISLSKINSKKREFSWNIIMAEAGISLMGITIGEFLEKKLYSRAKAHNSNKTWVSLEKISNLHSVVTGLAASLHQYSPTKLLAFLSLVPLGLFLGFNVSHQYRQFIKEESTPLKIKTPLPGTPPKPHKWTDTAKKVGWKIFQLTFFIGGVFLCFQPNFKNTGKSIISGSIIYQIANLINRRPQKDSETTTEFSQEKKTAHKIAQILRYPIFYLHLVPSAIMNYCKSYIYCPYLNLSTEKMSNLLITLFVFGGTLYGPYRYSNNHHKAKESKKKGVIRFDVLTNNLAEGVAGS